MRAVHVVLGLALLAVAAGLRLTALAGEVPPQRMSANEAYYLVLDLGADGSGRIVSKQLVSLPSPLRSMGTAEVASRLGARNREADALAVSLVAASGRTVYRSVVDVPRWLRGEFHGATAGAPIEGYVRRLQHATFAVRVPALEDGQLVLEGPALRARVSLALLDVEAAGSTPAGIVDTIGPIGDPDNRVDLVIVGDGYTQDQASAFEADAATIANEFFDMTPYAEYRNFVNVHTLFVPSAQSGADHPPYDAACEFDDPSCCSDIAMQDDPLEGTFVDTALDGAFCGSGVHRLVLVDYDKTVEAAAAVPEWDQIIAVVNDETYGGSGGANLGIITTNELAVEIAQHEYGHSFAWLADEYESEFAGFPACSDIDPKLPDCEANVTDETDRQQAKWAPWILPATHIPSADDLPAYACPPPLPLPVNQCTVGLFAGARYQETGMYRSGSDCLMRSLGQPMCPVPSQAYVLRLYDGGWGVPEDGIDLIEPGSESVAPGIVVTEPGAMTTIGVDLLQPGGSPPDSVAWYVDGVLVPQAVGDSYSFEMQDSGPHEVRLVVRDTTALVGAYASAPLESGRTWAFVVATPTPTATPSPTATRTATRTATLTMTPRPAPPGDADCDGARSPVDAALVLQLEAGMIGSLPCAAAADANHDGRVDAIDASLILQFVAGLLGSL